MALGATWQVKETTLINMAHQFSCHTESEVKYIVLRQSE